MPRKPHKNGLLNYVLVIKLGDRRLPFFLDMNPKFTHKDVTAHSSLKLFLDRWPFTPKPHVVGDSAFCSTEIIQQMTQNGQFGTFSCAGAEHAFLWKLLLRNLQHKQWQACYHSDGSLLASVYRSGDSDEGDEDEEEEATDSNTRDGVHRLMTNAWNFTLPVSEPAQPNVQKEFSEEYLKTLTVPQLKEICKKHSLKFKKTKENTIQFLMRHEERKQKRSTVTTSVLEEFSSNKFTSAASHHLLYKSAFNGVDLLDKFWYQSNFTHAVHHWRTKFIISIMEAAIVNAWVLSCDSRQDTLKEFRLVLASQLAQYSQK